MRAVRPVPEPVTLYSAALVNTRRHHRRSGARTPKSGRTTRDTPRLYALYSVVFRCHLHTISACKPYSRKGFRKCIQCIQRIPTPFVFRLSLLLGPEYMNTANAFGRSRTSRGSTEGGVRTPRSALPPRACFPRRVQVADPHAQSERNMPLRRE